MLEFIREWVTGIAAASILASIALALVPKGTARTVTRLAVGLLLAIAMIRPLLGANWSILPELTQSYEATFAAQAGSLQQVNNSMQTRIIQEQTAAYIVEKGYELGLDLTVEVTLREEAESGYAVPYAVRLTGGEEAPQSRRAELESVIVRDLGIAGEMISWSE